MLTSNTWEAVPFQSHNFPSNQGAKMIPAPNLDQKPCRARPRLLFVNKNANSSSLSHSEGSERIKLLSTAQRTSRTGTKRRSPSLKARSAMKQETERLCEFAEYESGYESQQSREKTRSPIAPPYDVPTSPSIARINRVQLTARFLESYYPIGMPGHTEVINKLLQWIQPTRGAVALAAADSMIALHAAQATGDRGLREEGMQIYQTALRLLRDELANTTSARDDSVLGAVEILAVAETRLLENSTDDCEAISRAHARGLYALFLTRGPSILQSSIGRNILLHHLHEPLMVSLFARKASIFGTPGWQAAFEEIDGENTGKMHRLTSLGCCIPGAFEKADATINNEHSTLREYSSLIDELTDLETRLMKWLKNRFRHVVDGNAYWTTTTTPSSLFHNQPTVLQDHFPFAATIEYHSFLDALAHINYWGLLLMLRKTTLDVIISFESAYAVSTETAHPTSEGMLGKCNEVADNFCQSAIYICSLPKPQSTIAKQGMVAFLVAVILPWYTQIEDVEKVTWCRSLIETFQKECEELDLVESVQNTWTTKLYIGWINMAF